MADVTKGIRGYATDTREYAANTRIDIHAPNSVCQVYASSRGNIKGYQSSHKYSQIRGLDIRRYADIRGHSHTQVHRDVSAYGLGHVSPSCVVEILKMNMKIRACLLQYELFWAYISVMCVLLR